MKPAPVPSHDNGFGAMRLGFAVLVLVSHAPETIDGDRHREILTRIFGSLSFGELAVDGFFVISGALITASWPGAASWRDYLWRRVVRIYPGFLVAFAACVLVVAPLGGGAWPGALGALRLIASAFLLRLPDVGPVFAGQPYPALNSAMWTIGYEFACYLGIAGLGLAGALRRPPVVLILAMVVLLLAAGNFWPHNAWRLVGLFLAGSLFHLWREAIPWRRALALLAAMALGGALFLTTPLAEIGFALFGGYLIFYLARAARGTFWARVNARNDISYGIYLYGWPMQKLVWWYVPDAPLPLAVERPALRWARRRQPAGGAP